MLMRSVTARDAYSMKNIRSNNTIEEDITQQTLEPCNKRLVWHAWTFVSATRSERGRWLQL